MKIQFEIQIKSQTMNLQFEIQIKSQRLSMQLEIQPVRLFESSCYWMLDLRDLDVKEILGCPWTQLLLGMGV